MQNKLSMLEKKKVEEAKKPVLQRNHRVFLFLDKECSIYEFAIEQLQWILNNDLAEPSKLNNL